MGDEETQDRRLSAIMFTDMVSYSALTQENEELAVELTGSKDPATLAGLGYVYAIQNKTGEATAILTQLKNLGDGFYVHPTYLAIIYLALGNKEETLDWLERGYQDRSEWMIFLQVEHMLDPLRGEERFVELVKKMNFKITENI